MIRYRVRHRDEYTATRWTGPESSDAHPSIYPWIADECECGSPDEQHGRLVSMVVCPGDYILQNVDDSDDVVCVRAADFKSLYEQVTRHQ